MKIGGELFADLESEVEGVAGPLVVDAAGNLLMLAARDLVAESQEFFQNGRKVGVRTSGYYPAASSSDPTSLVGWIALNRDTLVDTNACVFSGLADATETLGEEIEIASPNGALGALLIGVHAYVEFDFPWNEGSAVVHGLIRASLEKADDSFPVGWSGAAIQTRDGRLLGIVVGGQDGVALAVPAELILKAEGLSLANIDDVLRHNITAADLQSNSSSRLSRPHELTRKVDGPLKATIIQDMLIRWVFGGQGPDKSGQQMAGFSPFDPSLDSALGLYALTVRLADFAVSEIVEEREIIRLVQILAGLQVDLGEVWLPQADTPRSSFSLVMAG